jgi:GNAT superfamily N-acetyltransferase
VTEQIRVREIRLDEWAVLGRLLVDVYSSLDGFPKPVEEPEYYEQLANVGQFTERNGASVLVAVSPDEVVLGGVVYVGDMAEYGSPGLAPSLANASGIRLLGVAPEARGGGAGTALTRACIHRARESGHTRVVLHTTRAMPAARKLYEKLGFVRSAELDFGGEELRVLGFVLELDEARAA